MLNVVWNTYSASWDWGFCLLNRLHQKRQRKFQTTHSLHCQSSALICSSSPSGLQVTFESTQTLASTPDPTALRARWRTKMSKSEVQTCFLPAFLKESASGRSALHWNCPCEGHLFWWGTSEWHFRNWGLLDCWFSHQRFVPAQFLCFLTIWLLITTKRKSWLNAIFPLLILFES